MKTGYRIAAGVAIPVLTFAGGYAASNLGVPSWFAQGRKIEVLEKQNAALAQENDNLKVGWKKAHDEYSLPDKPLRVKPGSVIRWPCLGFGSFTYEKEFITAVLVDEGGKEYPFRFTNFDSNDQLECIASYLAMNTNAYGIMLNQNAKHFPRTSGQRAKKGLQHTPVEVEYYKDGDGVPTGIREIRCDSKYFLNFVPWVAGPDRYPVTDFERALGGIAGQLPLGGLTPEDQRSARRWASQYRDKLNRRQLEAIDGMAEWSETMRNYMGKRVDELFSARLKEQTEVLRSDTPD